jgi:predicted protein tyrosine phosphatase
VADYFVLKRADPPKKWQVRVPTASGRGKTVKFGEAGASDFTKHKDNARRQRYRDRHRRDNIRDPYSPGFWSWYVLWGESSDLDTAFKDAVRRAKKLLPRSNPELPKESIDLKTARNIGNELGVDWNEIDVEQFRRGLEVEWEHAETVGYDWYAVGCIVLDHLVEDPNYYDVLDEAFRENPMNVDPCIHVFSRFDLEAHLRAEGFDEIGGLISIGDPAGSEPWFVEEAAENGVEVLRLEFTDVADADDPGAPDEAAVGHLLAYLMDVLPDLDGCLYIHCEWGVSRSTAAALVAFSMAFGPGREPEAAAHLVEIAPQAEPNLLMITYADHMMHRDGRLLDVAELVDEGAL